jgi:hypothetical protein
MKQRMTLSGETVRVEKINDGRLLMSEQLITDPSYQEFDIWEFGVASDDFVKQPLKLYDRKYSSANGFTAKYETLWNKFIPIGTVLYDSKYDEYYICVESFDKDEILNNGKIVRCNGWLKWQNETGKIYEYPVFDINSTQYNSGVDGNKIMTLGSTQHMLSITADDNTIPLRHDKRFFIDRNKVEPTVFKLTQNDTTALNYDKGVIRLTVTEDQYNPDADSIENWLCDYIKPVVAHPIEITFIGNPVIRVGGSAKTFTANTDKTVTWELVKTLEQTEYITTVVTNNKCKIKCSNNELLIGSSVKLKCTDTDGNIGEILIDIVGGV